MLSSEEERSAVASAAATANAASDKGINKADGTMDVDTAPVYAIPTTAVDYLLVSPREVESWLLSLAIRILWRSSRFEEAYALSEKALSILDAHLSECGTATTSIVSTVTVGGGIDGKRAILAGPGGLHPLLARLLRYRNLTIESLPNAFRKSAISAELRPELANRHTLACLRRDGDVSSTVLNLMLRDLLNADQGELEVKCSWIN